ncbi:MAG: tRNA (5-methylaminomethyl-2-thiouridine)(34)-methyltransferase MnmD [Pseudomonadota bacterium]
MDANSPVMWQGDGVLVSRRYGDVYYSATDGLAESRYVFLDGNDLATRMPQAVSFAVGELGFGTGLNFLAAWMLWEQVNGGAGVLHYTAFEISQLAGADMAAAHRRWPELLPWSERLLGALATGERVVDLGSARLDLRFGDARAAVPAWTGAADAWFLDGFAPARNPEMWEPDLLAAVHARTRPGGSFATFTAAGAVRRALVDSGYLVTRCAGFDRKRHMLVGHRSAQTKNTESRSAT